jgi:hypothetical protein
MVNATVDNKPVSIQLSSNQSTTVPSNETWKIQVTLCVRTPSGGGSGSISVNGTPAIGATNSSDKNGEVLPQTVVTGNDTISLQGGEGASISGFVVDS